MTNQPKYDLGCPKAVLTLIGHLKKQGIGAYPVGGCVRDALLGVPPHDWDLAVETDPQTLMDVCKAGGYRVVPTGLQHGTVTVLTEAGHVECTSCRSEGGYTDGRHPDQVTFTYQLSDDLSRRDFTVNAMAANLQENGEFVIVDLFGGVEDLRGEVLRCVGDPYRRFTEDALRLLRGVRFCVKLGFDMDDATKDALVDTKEGLRRVSRERIADEFRKILCSPHPRQGVEMLQETGLMPYVLPYGISPFGMGDIEKLPADFTLRMGCLVWQVEEDRLREMVHGLKLSNAETHAILSYANPQLPHGQTPRDARLFRHIYGTEAGRVLQVCEAQGRDVSSLADAVALSEERGECVRISELAIDGKTLLRLGVPQDATLGQYLHDLLDMVIDDPRKNCEDVLIETVKSWLS